MKNPVCKEFKENIIPSISKMNYEDAYLTNKRKVIALWFEYVDELENELILTDEQAETMRKIEPTLDHWQIVQEN